MWDCFLYRLTTSLGQCMMEGMKNSRIQNLTLIALMAAILCITGPFVIPFGMVPMSLTNMVIYLTIILLDKKKATISVAIYLLIGFVGLPVFAGFTGGAGKLLGPTGGYLIGYLALSLIAGTVIEAFGNKNGTGKLKLRQMLALIIGTLVLYLIGTVWLMVQSKLNFVSALSVGVLPFIVFDVIKIVAAIVLGNSIKRRICNTL